MRQPVDVIVSGHLCLDLIPHMENLSLQALTVAGHLVEVGHLDTATGGAVSNVGLALDRLGVGVGLMATVGDDLIGQATVAALKRRDPSLGQFISIQTGRQSSYSIVLSPQRADRTFLHCTGTNSHFDQNSVDYKYLADAKLFHLGYPPLLPRLVENAGESLWILFKQAKALQVTTSMDMALPDPDSPTGRLNWRTILENVLPYVDIFLPSIEEILFMLRLDDYLAWQGQVLEHLSASYLSDLGDELLQMGAVIAGFKLGELGIYMRTAMAQRFERLKSLKLNVPDCKS